MSTPELQRAYELATEMFHTQPKQFMPHVSIMYMLIDEGRKNSIMSGIKINGIRESHSDKIFLMNTEGKVADWKKVAEFRCSGNWG
jgi:hypothetical protein